LQGSSMLPNQAAFGGVASEYSTFYGRHDSKHHHQ